MVILAAGASSRMGRPKALLPWNGGTFLSEACRKAAQAGPELKLVVTRAELESAVRDIARPGHRVLVNPQPEHGMLSSLQVAVRALPPSVLHLMVALVDQPCIADATFQLMATRGDAHHWVTPRHGGRGGHPVLIGRELFARILAASPDQSPRDVLPAASRLFVDVDDPAILTDFDTPEELAAASLPP